MSVYSHLSVISSACVTTLIWSGSLSQQKKNVDFYICSAKPTINQCPYTEKNVKVPDDEVLPF